MKQGGTRYFIGVDGGGTGCRAAIADPQGQVVAWAEAGPANATTDADQAIANVRIAVRRAALAVGLDETALYNIGAHVGLAGVLDDAIAGRIAAGLEMRPVTVTDDRVTSIAGALDARDGVLAAIGTGSTLAAQRGGLFQRIGGWGFALGDQASGAWLGRALLERVLLCHDGLAAHSALTRAVFDEFGNQPGGLVHFATGARPADYAALAPRIISASAEGDSTGIGLMQSGADYLLQALAALEFAGDDALCLAGGIGPHYADYLPDQIRAKIVTPEGTALDGALRLARAAADGAGS